MRPILAAMAMLAGLHSTLFADVVVQTRWDSCGVPGPVRDPGGCFLDEFGMSRLPCSNSLALDRSPLRHGIASIPEGVSAILCRDMDCDGDSDIVACGFRGRVVLYENAGEGGSFVIRPVFVPEAFGPERLACADIDADGLPDIAGTSRGDGTLRWWRNSESLPWAVRTLSPGEGMPYALDACDLEGDGDGDLLVGMWDTGELLLIRNADGASDWQTTAIFEGMPGLFWAEASADGRLVAITSFDDSIALVVPSEGGEAVAVADVRGPLCALPADMNGDGADDLLACSSWNDLVFWLSGGQSADTTVHIVANTLAPSHIRVVDMDGDGDMDLLSASEAAGELAWWESRNGGGRFSEHYIANLSGCSCCDAGDMDGDGRMDVVAGSLEDGSVSWWGLDEYRASGGLTSSIVYLGPKRDSALIELFGECPTRTSMDLEVRLSDDRMRMGEWRDAGDGDLTGLMEPGDRFLQYRVILSTENPLVTPFLDSVRVSSSTSFPI